MQKTCETCRFKNGKTCVKFTIVVNEDYKACNDWAEKTKLNESKIQLND